MNLDILRKQLATIIDECEAAKVHVYRCEGVIQYLKQVIADLEATLAAAPKAE
jgi:hypothetical protein